MDEKKLPPHNLEFEQSVVGATLIDPDAIPRVAAILEPGDFYDQECRMVWDAVLTLYNQNAPVDLLTVSDKLGGDDYVTLVTKLSNVVPTSVHAEHYAKTVEKLATRRRLLDASGRIARAAYDESMDLSDVEDLSLKTIIESRSNGHSGISTMSQLVREYYDQIEALAQRGSGILGLPTGYRDLDKIVGGLQKTDLILLGARPRMGKTSLATCITRNAAQAGRRVLFFSLEMSNDQITRRLVSLESDIPISTLKEGKLSEAEWPKFMKATDKIDGLPIWVDDTPGITPAHVRATALRTEAIAKAPLDLIVVDYLQLMRPGGKRRGLYEDVTEIGQSLKAIAKDLNVPMLALSQLNRACEQRSDKRPLLHDLRESGDLEQTANVVMFLYRDEIYDPNASPGLAEVAVAKNRDGSEGTAHLHFVGHQARFSSADITVL